MAKGALKWKSLRNTNTRATTRGARVMQNNIARNVNKFGSTRHLNDAKPASKIKLAVIKLLSPSSWTLTAPVTATYSQILSRLSVWLVIVVHTPHPLICVIE